MKKLNQAAKALIRYAEQEINALEDRGPHASIEDVEKFLSISKDIFSFNDAQKNYRNFVAKHYKTMKAAA